jgi:AI-2 transport protein TqsA
MTVPAVLIALVQANASTALLVTLGYVVVNAGVGNLVEPRLMGRQLGLSSVVVLLSLLFWGWILGPIGLFLSVPLTIALVVALDGSPRTRPIAIMLGSGVAGAGALAGKLLGEQTERSSQ